MVVGENVHRLLDPARRIRVPTLAAYGLQKALSSATRTNRYKSAKDLVYLYEIARHPYLGTILRDELPSLRARYNAESGQFRAVLTDALRAGPTLNDVCEQLHMTGRTFGSMNVTEAKVRAHFQRLLATE